mgnify:CR=1 FL=1
MTEECKIVSKSNEEWKQELTKEQYEVCRLKGTEYPFTGKYWNCKEDGTYLCVCCGNELFDSETKFESGTGWPSFWAAIDPNNVNLKLDTSYGMRRIEVLCNKCGSHLGHLFDDGPHPENTPALLAIQVASAATSSWTSTGVARIASYDFWNTRRAAGRSPRLSA